MKVLVVCRNYVKGLFKKYPEFQKNNYIISIYSSEKVNKNESYSPIPDDKNILKLQFDDVTELVKDESYIHFNSDMAKKVVEFIKNIKDDGKNFYVHCDAGVSRSGAVGYMLNEWFNKYIDRKNDDIEFFVKNNLHIMPNPLVIKLLKSEMFGNDYFSKK